MKNGQVRIYSADEARRTVLVRPPMDQVELPAAVGEKLRQVFGEPVGASEAVARIIEAVRSHGDRAVVDLTLKIDGVKLERLQIDQDDLDGAVAKVDTKVVSAMRAAVQEIERFHQKQLRNSWIDFGPNGALGQLVRPLDRVGVYVPGGRAAYPSSLLMAAVPARVAGVREIVVATPPSMQGPNPLILAAARIAGVDRVFQIGGAVAIAAMAYGTESVPKVEKVVGPGNIFVALAKKQVFGDVGVDQIAGPTETLLIADKFADPKSVAADLLAQAEHDPMARPLLITDSAELANRVCKEIESQLPSLTRRDVIAESLAKWGGIVVVKDLCEGMELANEFAPEHLCILTRDPWSLLPMVKNAGGVFLGEYSPEVMGDYVAGPSHIMPTGGAATFTSPINVDHFIKHISVVALSRDGFGRLAAHAKALAEAEGLTAHANAVSVRFEEQ